MDAVEEESVMEEKAATAAVIVAADRLFQLIFYNNYEFANSMED